MIPYVRYPKELGWPGSRRKIQSNKTHEKNMRTALRLKLKREIKTEIKAWEE